MAEYMSIIVNVRTGEIEENDIREVDAAKIDEIRKILAQSGRPAAAVTEPELIKQGRFTYLGTILHSRYNPDCITLYSPGRTRQVCH